MTTVSVVLPVLDEAAAIGECLDRILGQSLAPAEVVVADGGSTDATRELVAARAERDPRVRLVDNPARLQGAGLNAALAATSGDVVVRLDARSFVEPDYVARCVDLLDTTGAAVVGGRMVPRPAPGVVARGVALANAGWWGAGPARFHRGGAAGPVDTVYLGAFRRSWLTRVGGWASDVGVNEDFELNHRIRAAGGTVWLDPTVTVAYEPRRTLRAVARQYFRYGRSKATVLRRHPGSLKARQAVPAALVPAGIAALAPSPLRGAARLGLAAHVGLVAVGALRAPGAPPVVRATAAAAALVMHWSWAAGLAVGAVRPFPAAR